MSEIIRSPRLALAPEQAAPETRMVGARRDQPRIASTAAPLARPLKADRRLPILAGKTVGEIHFETGQSIYVVREMWRGVHREAVKRGLLTRTDADVLDALSDQPGWKTDSAWGNVGALAGALGLALTASSSKRGDSRTTRYALTRAVDLGLLRRHRRGQGKSDEFALVFSDLADSRGTSSGCVAPSRCADDSGKNLPVQDGNPLPLQSGENLPLNRGKNFLNVPIKSGPTSAVSPTDLISNPYLQIPTTTTTASVRVRAEPKFDQTQSEGEFCAFLAAYPFNQTMDVEAAEAVFEALSIDDRLKAIRFATLYKAEIKAQNRSYPLNAVNWLRKRKFDDAERIADAKAQNAGAPCSGVFVAKGTDAWSAWQATRSRGWPVVQHGLNNGWWFPSLFPPAGFNPNGIGAGLSLAQAASAARACEGREAPKPESRDGVEI